MPREYIGLQYTMVKQIAVTSETEAVVKSMQRFVLSPWLWKIATGLQTVEEWCDVASLLPLLFAHVLVNCWVLTLDSNVQWSIGMTRHNAMWFLSVSSPLYFLRVPTRKTPMHGHHAVSHALEVTKWPSTHIYVWHRSHMHWVERLDWWCRSRTHHH